MKKNLFGKVCLGVATLGLILGMAGCGNSGTAASSAASSKAASSAVSSAVSSSASSAASSAAASSAASAAASEGKYESKDGWSVRYDSKTIQANKIDDHAVGFVYTGECAGTCMVTVNFEKGKKPEDLAKEVTKTWGDVKKSESGMPGAPDKKALYYESTATGGSGLSQTFICGEYKDGTLSFEFIFHKANKEDIDMAVSDALAMVIDSVELK